MSTKKSSSDPLDGDTGDDLNIGGSQTDIDPLDGDTGDGDGLADGFGTELDGATGGEASSAGCPDPFAVGETFYRFTLNGLLGRGGTGVVYSATSKTGLWAIKIFCPCLRNQPELEEHFKNGHKLAKDLFHRYPGVVPIHDVGEKKGHVYVRMSPFKGCPTLARQLSPPSDRETLRTWLQNIFKPLCETIDGLHDEGIVHGDLKAANILVTPNGPVVIDFGLAMDFRNGLRKMIPKFGTQSIMSPEQHLGQGIGPASDRYTLGLLVYRYLSGHYPWNRGASNLAIRQAKDTNQLIPLRTPLVDELTGLADVVHKMLQRDPAQRYPRCIEFYTRLLECTELFRMDTSGSIREDDRIEVVEYESDPLGPLRQSKIRSYQQSLKHREPDLVRARLRGDELQRLFREGLGGQAEQEEFRRLLNRFPIWELAPLQHLPFSLNGHQELFAMKLLPAGRFEMGSPQSDFRADGSEKPQVGVYIAEGFWMSETTVTQDLYQAVMGVNPSHVVLPKHPVTKVSWLDAIHFCNRLSTLLNLPPAYNICGRRIDWNRNAGGFRLPTEAEWEFAALAKHQYTYAGSYQSDPVAWCQHNSANTSHPVGQKDSNGFGLYDMSGNVYEWCWDWYSSYPETTEQTLFQHSPSGPLKGDTRIARGGSFQSSEDQVRVKSRWSEQPNEATDFIGFRLVQSIR